VEWSSVQAWLLFFEDSRLGTVVVSVRTRTLTPTLRTHTTLTPHTYTNNLQLHSEPNIESFLRSPKSDFVDDRHVVYHCGTTRERLEILKKGTLFPDGKTRVEPCCRISRPWAYRLQSRGLSRPFKFAVKAQYAAQVMLGHT